MPLYGSASARFRPSEPSLPTPFAAGFQFHRHHFHGPSHAFIYRRDGATMTSPMKRAAQIIALIYMRDLFREIACTAFISRKPASAIASISISAPELPHYYMQYMMFILSPCVDSSRAWRRCGALLRAMTLIRSSRVRPAPMRALDY